jgi:hypothetical protein
VSFDVPPEKMTDLEIGKALERLVGYMKIRLPYERGFVLANAWYTVDNPEKVHVVMRSEWSDWRDIVGHHESALLEDRLFEEFEPHVAKSDVLIRTYAEVGSGPLSVQR